MQTLHYHVRTNSEHELSERVIKIVAKVVNGPIFIGFNLYKQTKSNHRL